MKVKVTGCSVQGFPKSIGFEFENGLILETPGNLVFLGKAFKLQTKAQMLEIIQSFEDIGIIVEGKEILDKL